MSDIWQALPSGQPERVSVTDRGDGTYLASWTYNRQGSHQISVSLEKDRKVGRCRLTLSNPC